MKKIKTLLFLIPLTTLSLPVLSDSFIRVINNSIKPLQAIWQAGPCLGIVEDWNDDNQFTVCWDEVIQPGKEGRYDFKWINVDRSVKVFDKEIGWIAHCTSMDYASITVSGGENGEFDIDLLCP